MYQIVLTQNHLWYFCHLFSCSHLLLISDLTRKCNGISKTKLYEQEYVWNMLVSILGVVDLFGIANRTIVRNLINFSEHNIELLVYFFLLGTTQTHCGV